MAAGDDTSNGRVSQRAVEAAAARALRKAGEGGMREIKVRRLFVSQPRLPF